MDLVVPLIAECGLRSAVETGTFRGDSTACLVAAVPDVWTAEVEEKFYRKCVQRFAGDDRVHLELGPSPEVLARIAPDVRGPSFFWLDAHYFPGRDEDPTAYCPALAELEAIRSYDGIADSCILIDDARMFLGPNAWYPTAEWPTMTEIVDALRLDADRHVTILDDVIIAVPQHARHVVDTWWTKVSRERNGNEYHSHQLIQALNPSPGLALNRLARSLVPKPVASRVGRRRAKAAARARAGVATDPS